VDRVRAHTPQAVLLLCNAIDTALLAQQFYKLGSEVPLFSSEWAFTMDLINFGGRAVEGMSSFHSFDAESRDPAYLAFRDSFVRRFGYQPPFASVLAYDAAAFLLAGLARARPAEPLKETLLGLGAFRGLQSEFTVDAFGDVERRLFLTRVTNGQFQVVD
jgi:branched-chain amino acid transport system substrate-binding protein